MPLGDLLKRIEELEDRVRRLEEGRPVELRSEVPKVILERRMAYIKISEEELHGRLVMLALDGFFNSERTASEVSSELIRRGWSPKDLKHVRPSLEHLVALGILDRRAEERKRGMGKKWLYKANAYLASRVEVLASEGEERGSANPPGPR